MPTLCDVNLLLALCYGRHIHHRAALDWLETCDVGDVVLCRMTQMSLMRLLCHRAVMGQDVCTLVQAWGVYDALLNDDRFTFCSEPDGIELALRRFTQAPILSPNLWQDAYLAAFAVTSGHSLATLDRAFYQFNGLRVVLIRPA